MPDVQLIRKTEAVLRGGCRIIQYRNKNDSHHLQTKQARNLSALCKEHQAILMINDNPELALEVGADGVHLGQQDCSIDQARKNASSHFIIGATCHDSFDLAQKAKNDGANYLAFGRFFPSQTKSTASPASLNVLKQARENVTLPIVAIGGITVDNAPTLIDQGAHCVAVSYDLFHHSNLKDIEQRAAEYCSLFKH